MSERIKYLGVMAAIPTKAETVLLSIMDQACVDSVRITSTTRTPADQARIMYANLEEHGVAAQKKLYKLPGQTIIDVYVSSKASGKSPAEIMADMQAKILDVGPQNVSRHCALPTVKSVFDVAPSSIPDIKNAAFEAAVSACFNVDKFLKPPVDPAYHIEINLA
jgi:hypothetical protein